MEHRMKRSAEAAQRAAVHARAMLAVLRDDAELVKLLLPAAQRRLTMRPGLSYATSLMLANLAGRTRQLRRRPRRCIAIVLDRAPRPRQRSRRFTPGC